MGAPASGNRAARGSRWLWGVALATVLLLAFSLWWSHSQTDYAPDNPAWNGSTDFLHGQSAAYLDALDGLASTPQALLISAPAIPYQEAELPQLKRFLEGGGTLLLADDYGHGNELLAYLGVGARFAGTPLRDPLFYERTPDLPRVVSFAPVLAGAGVAEITLNHATALTGVPAERALASSSAASYLDQSGNKTWDADEARGPFPVAAALAYGQGQLVLLADPSLLINSMLGQTDNRLFLNALLGERDVLVDRAHLPHQPYDVSKAWLRRARDYLSSPYVLLLTLALVFALTAAPLAKKGNSDAKRGHGAPAA